MTYRPKLIEVALPLDAINEASAKEKSIRHGHPSTLHLWWARRPLAACRAVLFGQLVDDPSGWPEEFPTEAAQDKERERLFDIIRELVIWENSNNPETLYKARLAIARTFARRDRYTAQAEGIDSDNIIEMMDRPPAEDVNNYLATRVPPVHDPFAGGGSIPLEAQRLGLRVIATDLNPLPVLFNKAMVTIPAQYSGMPPVNPRGSRQVRRWTGAQGLADDVGYYGEWMRERARQQIGNLYPSVQVTPGMAASRPDLSSLVGQELTVIAWIWARTVASPNPAVRGTHVPLVSSFWLSTKQGAQAWLEPVVDRQRLEFSFTVRVGTPKDPKIVTEGTKVGRGDFRCLLSGDPISPEHIRSEGRAGKLGARLLASVCEGRGRRIFIPASADDEVRAAVPAPEDVPDSDLPLAALGFRVQNYGLVKHRDLFSARQLTAMSCFSALVEEARQQVLLDAPSRQPAYADSVATYLALCVSKSADYWSSLCIWRSDPKNLGVGHVFARSALQMVWDYAEANPFSSSSGGWASNLSWIPKVIAASPATGEAVCRQRPAQDSAGEFPGSIVSSDPPYYDNVPYADLSDFFYVWLRKTLRAIEPQLFETVLVPKMAELVAEPYRHGGPASAEAFFLDGMRHVFRQVAESAHGVTAIYYAFKQSESESGDTSSTGWETFIDAVVSAGFSIRSTWPVRTELSNRVRGIGSNALASSIVLACVPRAAGDSTITRAIFRRELRADLPKALRHLQRGNIAPVDVAQASIGPGMAIFSRHSKVLEADGSVMAVRTALQLINEALDEYLSQTEGELDSETRFAVTWFENYGYETGAFGVAENIAKGRNVSVAGVAEAGILTASAGKVRLHRRSELPTGWNPATDKHLTVWEATQHLIKRLEEQGEGPASELLRQLGPVADQARALAYRLYSACERRKWAEEARAYNGLVVAWPELERLAAQAGGNAPSKPKGAQESLF